MSVTDGKDDQGAVEDSPQEDTFIYVDIEVADVNEPPEFDANLETEPTIAENTDVDQPIDSPFTATDPDDGETLTYGLSGTDAASFDIDTETGQIKTLAALDHETKETYSVTVTVSDGRDNAGNDETTPTADTTMDVTITVTDEDDPGTITLPSNQPSAGVELTATLDDDDGVKTDVDVTWVWESSLDPSDSNSWTVIDGATTNSYTPQQGDIDNFLRVTATYEDELGPGKDAQEETDSAVLTMPATNELPSFADDAPMTLSVQENTPAGENIGDPFTATDTDSGDTLTYVLDDQDGASFEVDAAGQIKTKSALDYETKDTYAVTVSVHDGKGPLGNANTAVDATIDVTINVGNLDIPDAPAEPTVTPTPGAAAGLTVTWPAIEPTETAPVDGYDVQYRRKDPTPPADWSSANVTVTGATAVITGLEYGTTYEVEVRSKNSEGESDWSPTGEGNIPSRLNVSFSPAGRTINEGSNGTFTVNVDPAADRALNIPITISSSNAESGDYSPTTTTVSFASGDTAKTFTITTTDDSDRDHETLSISFGQLPTAVGTGSQSTATLTINDTTPAPHTKSGGSSSKSGGGGGGGGGDSNNYRRSSSQVYIPPPSNSAPIFTGGDSTHRSVAENTGSSITIGSPVSATDADNDTLIYHVGGLDGASFSINPNSGHLLTSSVLDFEVQSSYSVYILVSDGEGGTDRIDVTVFVIDLDETPDPVPLAQVAVPTPEPTPVPPPTEAPTPEPTEEPTAVPTPTAVLPVGELPRVGHQQMVAPPAIVNLGNATQPGVGQTTMTVIPEDLRKFRIWPIILLVLGTAMELMGLGLFLKQREIDERKIWSRY